MISVSKGDVWLVDLQKGVGHEQEGIRPAIVLSHEKHSGIITVVCTTKNLELEMFDFTHTVLPSKENGLDVESVILIYQLRSLDQSRFQKKFGRLEKTDLDAIDAILMTMLKLNPRTHEKSDIKPVDEI